MLLTVLAIIAVVLIGAVALNLIITFIIPVAMAIAVYFLLRTALGMVTDARWLDGALGVAVFIVILWVII